MRAKLVKESWGLLTEAEVSADQVGDLGEYTISSIDQKEDVFHNFYKLEKEDGTYYAAVNPDGTSRFFNEFPSTEDLFGKPENTDIENDEDLDMSDEDFEKFVELAQQSQEAALPADQEKIGKGKVTLLKGKTKEEIEQLINSTFAHEPDIKKWLLENMDFIIKGEGSILFLKNNLLILKILKYSKLCKTFGISLNIWNRYNSPFNNVCGLFDFDNNVIDKFFVNPIGEIKGTELDIQALINERDQ